LDVCQDTGRDAAVTRERRVVERLATVFVDVDGDPFRFVEARR
jgi:hypothetical protein